MPDFPAAQPHGSLEQLTESVHFVRGSMRMNAAMTIARNMTIVRQGSELTLLNAVRLSGAGERELEALGEVKHVMRLSAFHGLDDPYYVKRYGARFWAPEGCGDPTPKLDEVIDEQAAPPMQGARFFLFRETRKPEANLHLEADGGSMLTCDSLQHHPDLRGNSLMAKIVMTVTGFKRPAVIGPMWLKVMQDRKGSLRPDFERLLELPFERLLGAHGSPLTSGAHAAVKATIARTYG
ncbi:MAG: hypothetical protein GXP55_18780 [Deltaproteobacteria bacterium]|nr:hypothetical protein [Deltaproteobacteria bacterium]